MIPLDRRIPEELPVVVEQRNRPDGRVWLRALPGLIDVAVDLWNLTLGQPFMAGSAAWVAPVVRRADGSDAVLKITLPHREARNEGTALRLWDGDGSVRLYEEDFDNYVLLVERCRPGTQLADHRASDEDRLEIAGALLRRLWDNPVPDTTPFETVDDVCREWAGLVRHRMEQLRPELDPGLVERGAELLETLPTSARRRVLVHGDFNPTNILRSEREPWLAIDAKPMLGDPGYDLPPIVLQIAETAGGSPDPARLRQAFGCAAEAVCEPVERLLTWSVARAVESALWNVSMNETGRAAEEMALARVLADLA